ncbi:MAG: 3-dehydroquinate synthase [Syntrophomonadaceae bacterium]|nr:3-dehydroquinate synthase [Syntrophomonadaceae bacterium]
MVRVELGPRSYDIFVGENWWHRMPDFLTSISRKSPAIMITDKNVFSLYGMRFLELIRQAGFQAEPAIIPGGEDCKNLATCTLIYEQMVTDGLDRGSTVFALGGGIVGDVAGFVAATYMRGIPYIQIPTTLLAQVDSSVGGKTGVNLPLGKNLVGAFHQPSLVFVEVDFLDTLPQREYLTGLAEVIKYGIIWDRQFFIYLEENLARIKAQDKDCLQYIISRCCEIKAQVVAQDETEKGVRAMLNLGHTFGHALEALTLYERYTHGEAVAIGTICAARLSQSLGLLSASEVSRIEQLIEAVGLPTRFENLDPQAIIAQMYRDKKQVGGRLQLVLPATVGQCRIVDQVPESQIASLLGQCSENS